MKTRNSFGNTFQSRMNKGTRRMDLLTLERVILPRDERVPHAHVGVVVSMQVPLAKRGMAVPLPLSFPLPLS